MKIIKNTKDLFLERLNQNQIYLENLVVDEDDEAMVEILQSKIIELKALYMEYILYLDISSDL